MISWLVYLSPIRGVRVHGNIALCSWARYFPLTCSASLRAAEQIGIGEINAGGNLPID